MRCPKCNNEVDYGLNFCPYCNHNLSFSTKVRTEDDIQQIEGTVNSLRKGYIIGGIVSMILLILLFKGLFFFMGLFYLNGALRIIDIVLKVMLCIGIVGFVTCIILFILKKKYKIMKISWIISLVFIIVPIYVESTTQIASLKDYSKVEYIELGAEKIPSLYSVVGKRNIVMSHNEDDVDDKGLNIIVDIVSIVYSDLSNDDIEKYKEALIDYGFTLETIYNTDENKYQKLLVKNNIKDNSFYVVSIDETSILYYTSHGTYQDALNIS